MGAFSRNLVNSPIRAALYLAKFNKLIVEHSGTMLAELISAERRSKTEPVFFECATALEDGPSERLPMIRT
jgi:hypothetical protein